MHAIARDVPQRIVEETAANLDARRQFLQTVIADESAQLSRIDAWQRILLEQRYSHFVAKLSAEAELRDLIETEATLRS